MGIGKKTHIMWVCGGVDSYGSVVGHPAWNDDRNDGCHSIKELACLTTWRWNIREQIFMDDLIPQRRNLTEEEVIKIKNWLFKRGWLNRDGWIKK